jgi:aminopeptidase N
MARLAAVPLADKKIQLTTALTFPNDFIGQEAIRQLAEEPVEAAFPLYIKGFESTNVFVRQAIALSLPTVPKQLQTYYESLLDDTSYVTQEAALFNLWSSFPQKRALYLDRMQGVIGFQDKNIRQLWLALSIVTPDYKISEKENFKRELQQYTSNAYSFEVRQKAFELISELRLYSDEVLKNLVNASVHHNWRFRNMARELLKEILENPDTRTAVSRLMSSFSVAEKAYLTRINIE